MEIIVISILVWILLAMLFLNFARKDRIPMMIEFFEKVMPRIPFTGIINALKNGEKQTYLQVKQELSKVLKIRHIIFIKCSWESLGKTVYCLCLNRRKKMPDLTVTWMKCEEDHWCPFDNLNLANDHFNELSGVYIIWSGTDVIRIGSGIIRDRIEAHRNDEEITAYENLLVTWAQVNVNQMEGVEKFLADRYSPLVGERFPDREPISVNLPWE